MLISKGQFPLWHLGAAVGSKKEATDSVTLAAIRPLSLCPSWPACTHRLGWKASCLGQQNIRTTCRVHHCVMILGSDWSICEKQIAMPPASELLGMAWGLMSCLCSSERCPGNTPLPGSQQKAFPLLEGAAEVSVEVQSTSYVFWL